MSVKVLRRIPRNINKPLPNLFESRSDAIKSSLGSLLHFKGPRKSASDEGPSAIELIKEFFTMNAPDISLGTVAEFASKLKMPLLVTIGVAAAAAIVYLVYKVYTNRETVQGAISKMLDDIKDVAPDLVKVPGWIGSIRDEIAEAFESNNPSSVVEKLVKIKDVILGHQKTINAENIGSGINFFVEPARPRKHKGGGIKAVIY